MSVKFEPIPEMDKNFPCIPKEQTGMDHAHRAIVTPILFHGVPMIYTACTLAGCTFNRGFPAPDPCSEEMFAYLINADAKLHGGHVKLAKCACKTTCAVCGHK